MPRQSNPRHNLAPRSSTYSIAITIAVFYMAYVLDSIRPAIVCMLPSPTVWIFTLCTSIAIIGLVQLLAKGVQRLSLRAPSPPSTPLRRFWYSGSPRSPTPMSPWSATIDDLFIDDPFIDTAHDFGSTQTYDQAPAMENNRPSWKLLLFLFVVGGAAGVGLKKHNTSHAAVTFASGAANSTAHFYAPAQVVKKAKPYRVLPKKVEPLRNVIQYLPPLPMICNIEALATSIPFSLPPQPAASTSSSTFGLARPNCYLHSTLVSPVTLLPSPIAPGPSLVENNYIPVSNDATKLPADTMMVPIADIPLVVYSVAAFSSLLILLSFLFTSWTTPTGEDICNSKSESGVDFNRNPTSLSANKLPLSGDVFTKRPGEFKHGSASTGIPKSKKDTERLIVPKAASRKVSRPLVSKTVKVSTMNTQDQVSTEKPKMSFSKSLWISTPSENGISSSTPSADLEATSSAIASGSRYPSQLRALSAPVLVSASLLTPPLLKDDSVPPCHKCHGLATPVFPIFIQKKSQQTTTTLSPQGCRPVKMLPSSYRKIVKAYPTSKSSRTRGKPSALPPTQEKLPPPSKHEIAMALLTAVSNIVEGRRVPDPFLAKYGFSPPTLTLPSPTGQYNPSIPSSKPNMSVSKSDVDLEEETCESVVSSMLDMITKPRTKKTTQKTPDHLFMTPLVIPGISMSNSVSAEADSSYLLEENLSDSPPFSDDYGDSYNLISPTPAPRNPLKTRTQSETSSASLPSEADSPQISDSGNSFLDSSDNSILSNDSIMSPSTTPRSSPPAWLLAERSVSFPEEVEIEIESAATSFFSPPARLFKENEQSFWEDPNPNAPHWPPAWIPPPLDDTLDNTLDDSFAQESSFTMSPSPSLAAAVAAAKRRAALEELSNDNESCFSWPAVTPTTDMNPRQTMTKISPDVERCVYPSKLWGFKTPTKNKRVSTEPKSVRFLLPSDVEDVPSLVALSPRPQTSTKSTLTEAQQVRDDNKDAVVAPPTRYLAEPKPIDISGLFQQRHGFLFGDILATLSAKHCSGPPTSSTPRTRSRRDLQGARFVSPLAGRKRKLTEIDIEMPSRQPASLDAHPIRMPSLKRARLHPPLNYGAFQIGEDEFVTMDVDVPDLPPFSTTNPLLPTPIQKNIMTLSQLDTHNLSTPKDVEMTMVELAPMPSNLCSLTGRRVGHLIRVIKPYAFSEDCFEGASASMWSKQSTESADVVMSSPVDHPQDWQWSSYREQHVDPDWMMD